MPGLTALPSQMAACAAMAAEAERDRLNHVVYATGRTHTHCDACELPITDDLWILRYPTPHKGAAFHIHCYRLTERSATVPDGRSAPMSDRDR